MIKIGIIGTGNIGKRHIQSIANISEEFELFCHDMYEDSLESLDSFFLANDIKIKNVEKIKNLDNFISRIDNETLVIISTTAIGRATLTDQILKSSPKAILLEKPVCQTLEEYDSILKNNVSNVPIYVNFPRHMYEFYNEISVQQDMNDSKIFVTQNDAGIACNGIHIFELICWLFDAKEYIITHHKISNPYETKRKGFYDISGEVKFEINKKIYFEFIDSANSTETINIIGKNKSYHIFETSKKMLINSDQDIEVENINIPFQSQLTSEFVIDLFKNSSTNLLPSINQTFLAHKMLFELLKLNKLSINLT
ncbi:hypothetical protein BVX95_00685 [archaeon D22]|nr:hypothetical protein BVX95_00685 [archaeon D22]